VGDHWEKRGEGNPLLFYCRGFESAGKPTNISGPQFWSFRITIRTAERRENCKRRERLRGKTSGATKGELERISDVSSI